MICKSDPVIGFTKLLIKFITELVKFSTYMNDFEESLYSDHLKQKLDIYTSFDFIIIFVQIKLNHSSDRGKSIFNKYNHI